MGRSELLYTLIGGYTILTSKDSNGNIEYIGEAQPGTSQSDPEWRISKISYDVNNDFDDIKWADGEALFTKKWDDRASYTYS